MTIEDFQLRRLVVSVSGLIYWAGVAIQARRIRRHIGRSPNVKPRGAKEGALWFGWIVVVLAWVGQPWLVNPVGTNTALALVPCLVNSLSLVVGLALVLLGYAGTLWTYAVMGDNWRMGINAEERTTLVCRGPYRYVRHPLYLLQMVMLGGAVLLLPTPVSFGALALHYLCVRLKVGDEESYLSSVHGDAYRDYCLRIGRLFPRWRRSGAAVPDVGRHVAPELESHGNPPHSDPT
jgi:protein-S-isoprenylcysteine O-methyltransferase Ste14